MALKKTSARRTASRKYPTSPSEVVIRNTSPDDLLDRFREFVLEDRDVQEGLRKVRTARDVTKLAAKHGFQLSERKVRAAARLSGGAISIDDLGGLLAGAPCWCKKSVVNSKSCKK